MVALPSLLRPLLVVGPSPDQLSGDAGPGPSFQETVGKDDTDLDLDDFSFVGAAEFARQSLLIGRRGRYNGPRCNHLVIRTHGFGRGERYSILIDEGTLDVPHWHVVVELDCQKRCHASGIDQ